MTDEEKAEEYAIKIADELRNKGFLTNEEIDQRYAGIVQGVLYGIAEGRKKAVNNCKNKYACIDVKTNVPIPCYQVHDCNSCSKRT